MFAKLSHFPSLFTVWRLFAGFTRGVRLTDCSTEVCVYVHFVYMLCSARLPSQTAETSILLFLSLVLFLYSFCFMCRPPPSLVLSHPAVTLRAQVNYLRDEDRCSFFSESEGWGPTSALLRLFVHQTRPAAFCDFICLTFTCGEEIHLVAHSSVETASLPSRQQGCVSDCTAALCDSVTVTPCSLTCCSNRLVDLVSVFAADVAGI